MKTLWSVLFLGLIFSACQQKNNQQSNLIGMWPIGQIERPDGEMKPVARWIKFEDNNRFTWGSGNHNVADSGKWILDKKTDIVSLKSDNGIDNDSEWKITAMADSAKMIGTDAKVNSKDLKMHLFRISERPLHHSDKLLDKWKFLRVLEDSIVQPTPPTWHIEFNPDGTVVTGADTGYWKMNDFVPILTIKSKQNKFDEWLVFMGQDTMTWKGTSTYKGQERYEVHLRKTEE